MKAVDLFAGCGGMSLGFSKSGVQVVAAYENWRSAINVYSKNFKNHKIFDYDLNEVDKVSRMIKKMGVDVIIGGPPCQDFSHAGKRQESNRANLTVSFAEIILQVEPKYFVMENVDRIKNSSTYKVARHMLVNAGYKLSEHVLDSSFFKVPQRRKRFFCFGSRYEEINDYISEYIDIKKSSDPMTLREYLGDELGVTTYYRHPRNYNRRGIFSIDEPAPTMRGVNRPVPKGYKGHHGDPVKVSKGLRHLTTMERGRVQTFPKCFKWEGSKTDLELMIGNAVPVNLARFVAQALVSFDESLYGNRKTARLAKPILEDGSTRTINTQINM